MPGVACGEVGMAECLSQEGTRGKRESLSYSDDLQGQPCFLMVPGVQNINQSLLSLCLMVAC